MWWVDALVMHTFINQYCATIKCFEANLQCLMQIRYNKLCHVLPTVKVGKMGVIRARVGPELQELLFRERGKITKVYEGIKWLKCYFDERTEWNIYSSRTFPGNVQLSCTHAAKIKHVSDFITFASIIRDSSISKLQ